MRPITIVLVLLCILSSCRPKTAETATQQLRQANFDLKQENDSLRSIIEKTQRTYEGDTIQKSPEETTVKTPVQKLEGRHALTLQWIGWDRPGSVQILPAENGWHTINGQQLGADNNYLKINGRIRQLSPAELEFDGKIEFLVDYISAGEPCIRTGKQLFKASGKRQYWRLQNMISCDGTSTDYVDIYF